MEVMGFSPDGIFFCFLSSFFIIIIIIYFLYLIYLEILENYRTVLSGDPENIFDDLLSPAYSSILWNQKNLIIKYGGREYWLEKIGVNNLNEIAQEMTYVIDKAGIYLVIIIF